MKTRIKDIAQKAGVSEGTVDRVLHGRGEVSQKSRMTVERVMAELNYQPNVYARSLALKKPFRIVVFIPAYRPGDYWQSVEAGFAQAEREFADLNVSISRHYYNQFDENMFERQAQTIFTNKPDAVVLAPTFRAASANICARLDAENIPFAFIDSMVEDTNFVSYYGQHSPQSGRTAAKLLLSLGLPDQAEILLVRTHRSGNAISNQTNGRYNGFCEYVEQMGWKHKFNLITEVLSEADFEDNRNRLTETFAQHPNIQAAAIFNSKVYRLAQQFEQIGHRIHLIGYDLLAQNMECLRKGSVAYLIAQQPEKQSYMLVRDLCRKFIIGQPIRRINYMPIDVLLDENIDFIETADKENNN